MKLGARSGAQLRMLQPVPVVRRVGVADAAGGRLVFAVQRRGVLRTSWSAVQGERRPNWASVRVAVAADPGR